MATVTKVGSSTLTSPVLAGGITNASITTATARPYGLATMDVDTGLLYEAINRKLQVESTLGEIFLDLGSDTIEIGQKVMVPDACIMRVTSEKGARTQVMPLENPLAGVSRFGTDQDQQGYERQVTLEYMKIYYNEYSQALIGEKWGMNYNDLQIFNYYQNNQPRLSKWFGEDEGRQYREALLERYSYVLEGTGTALTQSYNPNWFIANTEFEAQPAFDNTPATFVTAIDTAFSAAATGTNGVNANIDLNYLLGLNHYAKNTKRIRPVNIGGKQSYVVLIPSPQFHKLMLTNDGQLGAVWQNVSALTKEEQQFPGIIGRVKDLLLVEDVRHPTIISDYAGSHTIAYLQPGNQDARNSAVYSASNYAWDIGYLMGQAAIVDWMVTPLHFETETTEYGKRYGYGAFTERGIQLGATYDTDTASNENIKNFGSIVLAFSATSIVTTA